MKFFKIFVGLLVFTSSVYAQDTLWTRAYGGIDYDYGESVQECSDGGFIITGYTDSYGAGGYDVYLIRTDANGNPLWTKTYGGTASDLGHSVQECSSGGFIIAGGTASFGAGGYDVYLIRTDANGDTLWTKTYGGDTTDGGWSVQECSSGGFIIAGGTASFGAGGSDVYLIRTDANGDTLWTRTYGGSDDDGGRSVQECSDGGFIIAGVTYSYGAGGDDVYLIRTDSLGDTIWTRTYGGTDYDYGYSVQECSSGGFIIVGLTDSYGAGYADIYLIKTDENGDTLWTKTYGGPSGDGGYSVQECSSGGFIITGDTYSYGSGHSDVYLIRADSLGNTIWTKTYGGTNYDEGLSVQECASGGFIIAGRTGSFGSGAYDVYLIRTKALSLISPDGNESWTGCSTHNIIWWYEDTAKVNHYRLLFSTDGGSSYPDTIASGVSPDSTSWEWTTPLINSTTCRVKVQILDSLDNVISEDESDSNFSIQAYPTITYPNGGETWAGGFTHLITWTTVGQGFESYRLLYSTDGGSSYNDTIASGVSPDSTSWEWTTPLINSTTCRVKVQILDSLDNVISEDESDSNFSIQTYPTITYPNGGETWAGGFTHLITWSTIGQGFGSYRLLYSTDGGSSYNDTIASGVSPDSTSWEWTTPLINSTTCRVKVQILDSLDNVISEDESDSNFSIVEAGVEEATNTIPKTFSISQNPNPFTRYAVINYQIPVKSKVSLRIYDITGRLVKTLAEEEKEAGYYTIRWDASGIKSGIYFIKFKANNYEETRKMVLMK